MTNLRIYCKFKDDNLQDFSDCETGKELIDGLIGDDTGAPPRSLEIMATADDGSQVIISIPYSDSSAAHVSIERSES
jgi:hypothetical protein